MGGEGVRGPAFGYLALESADRRLLWSCRPPSAPNPDDHDDARLWVAHGGRLLHLAASGAMFNKLGRDLRAVAADPVRVAIATFRREPFTDDGPDHGP